MPSKEVRPNLKTLNDHNRDRIRIITEHGRETFEPHANGIACPNCGAELYDSQPYLTLTSDPPQKNIHCPNCHYAGHRIA
jgi:DNA-directed RNA polymerase subunit RPC12/RpoP